MSDQGPVLSPCLPALAETAQLGCHSTAMVLRSLDEFMMPHQRGPTSQMCSDMSYIMGIMRCSIWIGGHGYVLQAVKLKRNKADQGDCYENPGGRQDSNAKGTRHHH